jgi:hypothetical protein
MPVVIAEMLLASVHIVGAIALSVAWLYWMEKIGYKWANRTWDLRYRDFSLALGLPAMELKRDPGSPEFARLLSERYGSESIRNRLCDLLSPLLLAFELLCVLVQLVAVGMVFWTMFKNGLHEATLMWVVPIIGLFCTFIIFLATALSLLILGRGPGEAKYWREAVSEAINRRAVRETAATD